MKQKLIKNTITAAAFFILIAASLILPQSTLAITGNCDYGVTFSSSSYSPETIDTITLTAAVVRTPNASAATPCVDTIWVYFEVKSNGAKGDYLTMDSSNVTIPSSGSITKTYQTTSPLPSYTKNSPTGNVLNFRATINNYANGSKLTQSGDVAVTVGGVTPPPDDGAPCTTTDSSDCAAGYFCDIAGSKTCKAAAVGTDCSKDATICPAPLACVSGKCAAGGGPNPGSMGANNSTTLYNPLPEGDLVHAFLIVAQGFLAILGVLAVVFIIVGGFQMTIAAGNEEALVKAKKTIIWAILGLVVAILSFSIIAIVQDLLQVQIQPSAVNKIERRIS